MRKYLDPLLTIFKTFLEQKPSKWRNIRTTPHHHWASILSFPRLNRIFQRKLPKNFSEIIVAHNGVWSLFLSILEKHSRECQRECSAMGTTSTPPMASTNSMLIFPWDRCEIYNQASWAWKFHFSSFHKSPSFFFSEENILLDIDFSSTLSYFIFWQRTCRAYLMMPHSFLSKVWIRSGAKQKVQMVMARMMFFLSALSVFKFRL